jgi:hypothetical protein
MIVRSVPSRLFTMLATWESLVFQLCVGAKKVDCTRRR